MRPDLEPQDYEGEVAELLSTLIRNGCVNDGTPDSGGESRSVATLQAYLGEQGSVHTFRSDRGNLVYRLPGNRPGAPSLGLMGHIDVVPANPDGWSRDPFGGETVDGEVWGRGAVDMLNMTAAMAAVFKRFLNGTWELLPGDLVFLAVADEEAGARWGVESLMESQRTEIACDYLLTEVPLPSVSGPDGPVYPIKVGEKGPFWRILRASGLPGHGSLPFGTKNALLPVARAVERLTTEPSPVQITAEWRAFVEALDLPADLVARLTNPEQVDGAIAELSERSLGMARYAHACTHLTLSPNVLRAGSKANVIPDVAEMEIDIRALPGQDATTVDDHLRKVLGPDYEEVEMSGVMDFPAGTSEAAGPLWEATSDAIESLTGTRRVVPALTPMATDARFFRELGTVAYGVALFEEELTLPEFLSRFHGNDERISIESLGRTAALYARTVERFGELSTG